jgi:hypothetical protein
MEAVRTIAFAVCVWGCNHLPAATTAPAAEKSAQTELPKHPYAVPDELMEFRASLRGIHLGVLQTAVGKPGWIGDHRAIIVKSRGHSDGIASLLGDIRWELSTTIDLDAGYPLEDREETWVDVTGDHEHHNDHHTWDASEERHDPHSFAGVLRGWHSEPGQTAEVNVGVAGAHLPITLRHAGREMLAEQGKPAIRYEGRVRVAHEDAPFEVWISDDTARVPLAFRAESPIGTIAVDLVDYHVTGD